MLMERGQQQDCPSRPSTSQVEVLSTCSSSRDSGIQADPSIQHFEPQLSTPSSPSRQSSPWPIESETFSEREPLIVVVTSPSSIPIHGKDFLTQISPSKQIDCSTRLDGSRFSLASYHSAATSSSSHSLCRICHLNKNTRKDPLISPCRCSGSMLYLHKSCLVHWLELSTRKMVPSPRCELCGYFYRRGNFFSIRRLHGPHIDTRDRILNCLFLFVLLIMIVCAGMALHFLHQQHYTTTIRGYRIVSSRLSQDDFIVIVSSILFFVAFFVAIFTQYRAEASIFRICFRLWVINRNWTIRNYRFEEDEEMLRERGQRQTIVTIQQPILAQGNGKIDRK
ncbi:unnamed protein product, partial [Mesorhabditis belari]|uniref:RING-CH-type domain-containing protein n=1 Tax=Mesorhabditis belari TaxID=2138241 RepID=A0AAF3EDH4_9BILA